MEFEQTINELALANFTEIKKFINFLTDTCKRKKIGTITNDLVYVLFILEKLMVDMILKNQTFYILVHADKIMDEDGDFFYNRPQIFGQLPEDKVNVFRDVYASPVLDESDKRQIWDMMKTFLIYSCIYQGHYNRELTTLFSSELSNFFAVMKINTQPNKKEELNCFVEYYENIMNNYSPEVLMAIFACKLVPYETYILNKNQDIFFNESSIFCLSGTKMVKGWLVNVLVSEVDVVFWQYLESIKEICKNFIPQSGRLESK